MTRPIVNRLEWHDSAYAKQYFLHEQRFLDMGLRQSIGPSVLQLGGHLAQSVVDDLDLPFLVRVNCPRNAQGGGSIIGSPSVSPSTKLAADLIADPAFLPFAPDSFATVILPHVLEGHRLTHQVLREAQRVLMSEGHLVVTGFNPISLIGLQRLIRPKAVCKGRYYTAKRVIDWLQLLGFEVVASSMFHYAPLCRSARLHHAFNFLEAVGDRWLPMTGGGYMISAKKREASGTLVGSVRFDKSRPKLLGATASASAASKLVSQKTSESDS